MQIASFIVCMYVCIPILNISELLRFIWPSTMEGDASAGMELRSFDLTEKAVREKILHKMGLLTNTSDSM